MQRIYVTYAEHGRPWPFGGDGSGRHVSVGYSRVRQYFSALVSRSTGASHALLAGTNAPAPPPRPPVLPLPRPNADTGPDAPLPLVAPLSLVASLPLPDAVGGPPSGAASYPHRAGYLHASTGSMPTAHSAVSSTSGAASSTSGGVLDMLAGDMAYDRHPSHQTSSAMDIRDPSGWSDLHTHYPHGVAGVGATSGGGGSAGGVGMGSGRGGTWSGGGTGSGSAPTTPPPHLPSGDPVPSDPLDLDTIFPLDTSMPEKRTPVTITLSRYGCGVGIGANFRRFAHPLQSLISWLVLVGPPGPGYHLTARLGPQTVGVLRGSGPSGALKIAVDDVPVEFDPVIDPPAEATIWLSPCAPPLRHPVVVASDVAIGKCDHLLIAAPITDYARSLVAPRQVLAEFSVAHVSHESVDPIMVSSTCYGTGALVCAADVLGKLVCSSHKATEDVRKLHGIDDRHEFAALAEPPYAAVPDADWLACASATGRVYCVLVGDLMVAPTPQSVPPYVARVPGGHVRITRALLVVDAPASIPAPTHMPPLVEPSRAAASLPAALAPLTAPLAAPSRTLPGAPSAVAVAGTSGRASAAAAAAAAAAVAIAALNAGRRN